MTEQATRGARAESLAARFEQVNAEVIATVEGLTEAQWAATTPEERWTVAVTAHHVATAYPPITRIVEKVIAGGTLPNFREGLDERNQRHAQEFATCDRQETLALLRDNGARAAAFLRGLDDAQLERSAELFGCLWSASDVVERILLGHPRNHLASIQRATSGD